MQLRPWVLPGEKELTKHEVRFAPHQDRVPAAQMQHCHPCFTHVPKLKQSRKLAGGTTSLRSVTQVFSACCRCTSVLRR